MAEEMVIQIPEETVVILHLEDISLMAVEAAVELILVEIALRVVVEAVAA